MTPGKPRSKRLNTYRYLAHLRAKARSTWLGDCIASAVRPILRTRLQARLEHWFRTQKIDMVWFLEPPGAAVSIPFITGVWDLQHRSQPYFPEVSITGWNWEARERTYRSILPRASFILTGTQVGKQEIVHYYGVNCENVVVIPLPTPTFDSNTALPRNFWNPTNNQDSVVISLSTQHNSGLTRTILTL